VLPNLTISLHGATEEKRRLLMPGSPMSLSQLQNVIMRYKKETNRYVSIVYCLFRNVNDSPEDADALIQFARGLPCKVNLLNYNEIKDSRYSATTVEGFEEFRTRLRAGGISVLHRKSLGTSIGAGCGQLGAVKQ
jgi:23S rRNA (adenine2503-C2)-methyltransferase